MDKEPGDLAGSLFLRVTSLQRVKSFSSGPFDVKKHYTLLLLPRMRSDLKTLNDVPSGNDDDCFCLDDFTQLDLFHSQEEEYANINALPDLGSFEDTDDVASYYK